MTTTILARLHEVLCRECRVTWRSWIGRLFGSERRSGRRWRAEQVDA